MKKAELIDVILTYENLGEMSRAELEKHTVKELNLLKKEMDEELATENAENAENVPTKSTEKQPEKAVKSSVQDEKEKKVPEQEKEEKEPVEPVTEFSSMCGFNFDPSANSGCNTQCCIDYPDSYKECKENFSVQPVKKTGSKPKGLGMNIWYHRPGTQGGLLDDFFLKGNVGTIQEIAEFAGCNPRRVMIHIKHLIFDFGVEILEGQKKNEDGKLVTAYFLKNKNKNRKGTEIIGKTGFPKGYPKSHPLYTA